jgi:argininosuccinate lyase
MLPQKKNSDVAELTRGKCGRLVGNLTGLLVMLKGLPLSYNRDLQEDKEPLFDSIKQVSLMINALGGAYRSMTFNAQRAQSAAHDPNLVAIDIAEKLVLQGVPFRQAHEQVGELVAQADREGLSLLDVVERSADFSVFADLFASGASLTSRSSPGASGPLAQSEQAKRLLTAISLARERLASC